MCRLAKKGAIHSDRPAADKQYPLLAALDLERDAAERAELQRILDQVDLADDRIFATVFNASERKASVRPPFRLSCVAP